VNLFKTRICASLDYFLPVDWPRLLSAAFFYQKGGCEKVITRLLTESIRCNSVRSNNKSASPAGRNEKQGPVSGPCFLLCCWVASFGLTWTWRQRFATLCLTHWH